MGCKKLNTDFFNFLEIVHSKKKVSEEKKRVNYYPFGLEHKGYNENATSDIALKKKYNGVEYEEALGLDMYEMPFRNYDAAIGRFKSIDPLAEIYGQIDKSPYAFAWNNPIVFSDPSGLCPDCPDPADAYFNQIYTIGNGSQYIFNGFEWERYTMEYLDVVCIGCDEGSDYDWSNEFADGSSFDAWMESVNWDSNATDALGVVGDGLDILEARQVHLSNTVVYNYGTALESADEITSQARNWHRNVAKNAGRLGVGVQVVTGGIDIYNGLQQDGGQFGQNAQRATAGTIGGVAGTWAGAEAGATAGAAIGVWFGGVGAVPGALIGGVIGGFIGNYAGSKVGEASVNYYYKQY